MPLRSILCPLVGIACSGAAHGQWIHEYLEIPLPRNRITSYAACLDWDEDLIVFGNPFHDDGFSGTVYVFDSDTGGLIFQLAPDDLEVGDHFGSSVAIDGGIIAVGAMYKSDVADGGGAVYLFDASTGEQLHRLHPESAFEIVPGFEIVLSDLETSSGFGRNVAIADGMLIAGIRTHGAHWDDIPIESGSVLVFDVATGEKRSLILPPLGTDPDPGGFFGWSVAIDSPLAVVGYPKSEQTFLGSVYIYDVNSGALVNHLALQFGENDNYLGGSVDIRDGIVAVGNRHRPGISQIPQGVYMFDASTGVQYAELKVPSTELWHEFGHDVSVGDGVVSVGSRYSNDLVGAVYVFDSSTGELRAQLAPEHLSHTGGTFGQSLVMRGERVAASATSVHSETDDPGIYIFRPTACSAADLAIPHGTLNIDDIEFFALAFLLADLAADCDGSGTLNLDDIDCFVAAFLAGCP